MNNDDKLNIDYAQLNALFLKRLEDPDQLTKLEEIGKEYMANKRRQQELWLAMWAEITPPATADMEELQPIYHINKDSKDDLNPDEL